MIADTREIEKPGLVLGERGPFLVQLVAHTFFPHGIVFENVRRVPFLIRWQIAQYPRAVRSQHVLRFKNSFPIELAVRFFLVSRGFTGPLLVTGIGLLQKIENLGIPELRITAVGLGLDIGPPHLLLAFAEGPSRFARHGATLARDAAVDVEDKGKLAFGKGLGVRVIHLSADLPVVNVGHRYLPVPPFWILDFGFWIGDGSGT